MTNAQSLVEGDLLGGERRASVPENASDLYLWRASCLREIDRRLGWLAKLDEGTRW